MILYFSSILLNYDSCVCTGGFKESGFGRDWYGFWLYSTSSSYVSQYCDAHASYRCVACQGPRVARWLPEREGGGGDAAHASRAGLRFWCLSSTAAFTFSSTTHRVSHRPFAYSFPPPVTLWPVTFSYASAFLMHVVCPPAHRLCHTQFDTTSYITVSLTASQLSPGRITCGVLFAVIVLCHLIFRMIHHSIAYRLPPNQINN